MSRLFHFSDTHLGHAQYARTDGRTGLNQREQDHYDAFAAFVDVAVREQPDCVIHAGDVFDGVRPSNRALAAFMDGLLRLSGAGIPVVVIAGNHEHPRLRETGSALRLFAHIPGVHAAFRGRAESFAVTPGLTVHAVPQCQDNATIAREVEAVTGRCGDSLDVLVLHGAVASLPAFHHAEFNELTLDPAWFAPFDYVALGHYHGTTKIASNAWYSGAPDRVSMAESGEEKGYLDVRLADDAPPVVAFRALPVRPYADLAAVQADGLGGAEVVDACRTALAAVPDGAVVRLRVTGLRADLRGGLDQDAIRAAAAHAMHLDLRLEWADNEHRTAGPIELRGLREELAAFAASQPMEGQDRTALVAAAEALLAEVGAK